MFENYGKRALSFLMALIMVFSMVPVQAFATETEEAHDHCEVCGQHDCICPPEEPEHVCEFVAGEVVAPTCGAAGYTVYTCGGCGAVENRDEVAATGAHTYVEAVVGPTETEQGYTAYSCSVCGHSYKDNFVDALAPAHVHEYVAGTPVAATPEAQGYTPYACSCGDSYKDNFVDYVAEKTEREIPLSWTDEMKEIQALIDKALEEWLVYYGFEMPDQDKFADLVRAQLYEEEIPAELEAEWKTIRAQIEDVVVNKMTDNERENATAPIREIEYTIEAYAFSNEQMEMLYVFNPVFFQFVDLVTVYAVSPSVFGTASATVLDGKLTFASNYTGSSSLTGNTDGTVTIKAQSSMSSPGTNTVTVTNTGSGPADVAFNYSGSSVGSMTIEGASITVTSTGLFGSYKVSGSYSKRLSVGDTITIVLNGRGAAMVNDSSVSLSGITWTEVVGTAQVTMSYDSSLGKIQYDGVNVSSGSTETININKGITAVPNNGVSLLGWVDAESGAILSTAATYIPAEDSVVSVKAAFSSAASEAWFKVDGTRLFNDLNAATAAGTKIVLAADGTLPAGNYTIPSGDTLLIPMNTSETVYTTMPNRVENGDPSPYTVPSAYRTLTMAQGANITVAGAISVAGSQIAGGTGYIMGGVHGPVGFIQMAGGSKITVNSGAKLYAWGYVTGSGEVEVLSGGTVYESFQTTDWRGGSATSDVIDNQYGVFPMNQYYVQNIEVPMKLNAGAEEKGYSCTTVTMLGVQGAEVPFVGENSLFTIESGYLIKDYDEAKDRQTYKIYGDVSMDKIVISMTIALGKSVTLDSSKYVLPITNNLTVDVVSGKINITQDLAFLPGAEIIIRQGASCDLANGKSVYVYDLAEWGGYCGNYNRTFIPLGYAPGRTTTRSALTDARIQIDGTVNADAGFLYTTASGAVVISTGTGVVKMMKGTATKTYQYTQSDKTCTAVEIPITVAKLQNADGTTPATTDPEKINPELGVVYTYTNGIWVADCPGDNTCTSTVAADAVTCKNPDICQYCEQVLNPGEHKPGAAATCTVPQTCTVCGDTLVEALNHKNGGNVVDAVTPKCYSAEAGHLAYYTCKDCGLPFEDNKCTKPIADLNAWLAEGGAGYVAIPAHSWNDGEILTGDEPTCTETGTKTFTCKVCSGAGYTTSKTETAPATGHTSVTAIDQENATCTADGVKAHYYCKTCGTYYESRSTTDETYLTGLIGNTEDALNAWKSGNGKITSSGHNKTKTDEAASTCTANGHKAYWYCDKCTTYYSDEDCTVKIDNLESWLKGDGQLVLAQHAWEVVAAKKATCKEPGYSTYNDCKNCDAEEGKTVYDKLPHAGNLVKGKGATCSEAGWKDYYQCKNGCNAYFEDEACTNGIKDLETWKTAADGGLIKALGHYLALVPEVPKTCTTAGTKAYYQCKADENSGDRTSFCGAAFEDDKGETPIENLDSWKNIPASHTAGEAKRENEDTATGIYDQVVYCTECGKEMTRTTIIPGESAQHKLVMIDRIEPTCYSVGYTAGAYCEEGEGVCAACTADGETYRKDPVEIAMVSHTVNPSEIKLEWSSDFTTCTASATCVTENCGAEVKETVAVTETERVDATCETAGSVTYTSAAFTDAALAKVGYGAQTTSKTIAPLTHQWGATEYQWSTDNSTCTATRKCERDTSDSCVETETVESTNTVTDPTCEKAGYTTYSADFTMSWTADQTKKVDGDPATGHTWAIDGAVEWNLTGEPKTCTVNLKCENDSAHTKENVAGTVVETKRVEATCDKDGVIYYSATFAEELKIETQTTEKSITKLEHNWTMAEPVWTWKEEDQTYTCTMTRTCDKYSSGTHKEEETVQAVAGQNSATCTTSGEITYTAKFENTAFGTQTKTETPGALGHDVERVAEVSPTCQKSGVAAHYMCTRDNCGKLFMTEEDAKNNVPVTDDDLIMVTGCKFVNYTYNNDASCTKAGTKTASCKYGCGETSTIDDTDHPQLDHVFTNYIYNNDASCQKAGTETAECDTCDTEKTATRDSAEHPKLGHEYEEKVTEEATCTTVGTKQLTCKNGCNHSYSVEIAKLGHVYAEQQGKEATCSEEGWKNYYQCAGDDETRTYCGLYFANVKDTTSIDLESWKTGDGKLEKIAHDYDAVVTAPTCLEKGYTTYTCKNCPEGTEGHSYVADYKDTLNHKYDSGAVTTQPTCTEAGIKTFTCQNDCCDEQTEGHTYTEPVDALGHNLVTISGQASTCAETGYNAYYQCAAPKARTGERSYCGYYFANASDTAATAIPIATTADELTTWQEKSAEEGGGALALRECKDENHDHDCDYEDCKNVIGEHKDDDKNHVCDTYADCATGTFGIHEENKLDQEHKCDYCGKKMGDHVFTDGVCTCQYVQDLKVTITIVAEGTSDQTLPEESIKYGNDGAEYTKVLDLTSYGDCYTIQSVSAKVGGKEVESTYQGNALTIASEQLTGDIVITVNAYQNHVHGSTKTDITAAKCEEEGKIVTTLTCKNCGKPYSTETEIIPALKHEYNAVYTEPTFDADGFTTYTCKNGCGDSYTETDDGTQLIAVARIGSTRYQTLKEAIEAAGNRDTIELLAKGVVEDTQVWDKNITMLIPAVDDSYGLVIKGDLTIKRGTFIVNGFCGIGVSGSLTIDGGTFELEEEVDNDYLIGSWGTTVINGGTFVGQYNCVNAFQGTVEIKGGNFTTADKDCTGEYDSSDVLAEDEDGTAVITSGTFSKSVEDYLAEGHCQRKVGEKYYVAPHSSGEAVQENTVPATCTDNGSYQLVTKCTRCDAELSRENKVIDATGHTVKVIAGKAATCLEPGYHEAYHCTVCSGDYATRDAENDKLLSDKIEDLTAWQTEGAGKIDALGHDLVHTEEVPAACETSGVKEYWQCSRCKAAFEDKQETTPIADLEAWKAEGGDGYISATDHNYTSEVTTQPTCTEDGVRTYTCQNDKTHTKTEVVSKLNHDYAVEYKWNEDRTACTASAVCKNNPNHNAQMTAVVSVSVTTAAGCENDGAGVRTAKFDSNDYGIEDQSEDVVLPATNHSFTKYVSNNDATCTEDGTKTAVCDNGCGKEDTVTDTGSAKGHKKEEIAEVRATCTNNGIIHHYFCSACLGRFYDAECNQPVETGKHIAPALEHDYQTEVTKPDCENKGYTTYTCSRGDHTYKDNYVDALGHDYDWDGGKIVTAPTCDEGGYTTYDCARCDETHIGDQVTATGHDYKNMGAKAGTCTEVGWKAYYQCQNSCGLYYEYLQDQKVYSLIGDADALEEWKTGDGQTSAYGHDWKEVAGKTPDCDDAGYLKSYQCGRSACGLYFSEKDNDKLIGDEAAWNVWIAEGGAGYLKPNGHTEGEKKNENVIAPKCDAEGSHDEVIKCTVCTAEISREHVVDPKIPHTETTIPAVAPDCTNTGLTEGKKCSACGEILEAQTVVKANGHTTVVDNAVEATCTATGLTEGAHCGVCNEPLVVQTVVPMKAHTHNVLESTTNATCTVDGSQVWKCENCTDTITKVLEAEGHNSNVTLEAVDPTCTDTGLTEGKKCSVCGETQVAQETIPATGHTKISTIAQVDSTCKAEGVKLHYFCDVCDTYYEGRSTIDETYLSGPIGDEDALAIWKSGAGKIDKKPHTEKTIDAVSPTCTETGLTSGVECSVCGDILVAQTVVDAKGHNKVVDKAVAPTCTETGLTEGEHCSVCGTVTVSQEIVPANGHLNVTTIEQVDPDCTEDGVKEHYFCADCSKYFATKVSDTELSDEITNVTTWKSGDGKINKLGHKEEVIPATAPTCTATGLTAGKKCTVCGKTTVAQDSIPANGHKEVIDGKVDPTCTETGLTEGKHCSVCNDVLTKQEVVEAKGHTGELVEGLAAKCEADGWKDYYQCKDCKLYFQDEACEQPIEDLDAWKIAEDGGKIAQLGHSWDEGRVTTLPTCTEDGVKTFTCGTCNGTRTEAEPKLGHDLEAHDAQHPTYYSVGWEAYETCTRCEYSTYESIEPLGEPSVGTFNEFMTSLKLLEEYANDYVKANPNKDPMGLLIKYVRTGVDRYNSGSWNIMAGYEDEAFAEYVMKREEEFNKAAPTIDDMINVTGIKNIKNFTLPNGDSVDFGHMFGTMDITYTNKTSINHADVAGWAGDLVDLLSTADRHDVTGTVDEMIEEIGDKYLNHSIAGESDQFSQTDMYGDLDGYYFMNELIGKDYENGMLYSMMSEYFVSSLTTEQRADYFLKNRLGGVTGRTEIRDAVFAEYTGNSVIATLEGTREFKQADVSDMRKACCYAFADYLCKLAGDYVELGGTSYLSVFSSETSTLAPGITQQISKATTSDGKQVVYYTATGDVMSPYVSVYANYKDNDPASGWGMQRVRDQANAAQAKYGDPDSENYIPNYNVIAAINGAGYNMSTGEPSGVLMMGGVEYHAPNGGGFFGIRKDGTPCLGSDAEYYALKEKGELSEAIAIFGATLIKDGKITIAANDYSRASRTAIGYTKTGKVVFMVMDGRQEPVSCGGSMAEIAQVMLEAGCVYAVNLDGGGSTTYLARQEGDEELSLVNSPSDGFERSVSTSWIMVSTAPSSTAFDHAALESEVKHLTVGATVQVTASGVSATGNPAELPEGVTWAVSDTSVATISEDGVVTGVANGQFDVQLMLDDEIVGSRTMYVVVPDAVYFTKDNMNAVYGEPATLPVAAKYENKPVAIVEEDVSFTLSKPDAGTTEGFTFTGIEASNIKTVKVTAHAVNNSNATSGSININLFSPDEAAFDFENANGGDRLLAWNRVVSNSTTVDSITYTAVDKEEPMITEYTFGMDMTQIPMPEKLEDLVYMLPGADVEGNNSAWSFLLQLAERVSVLTEVKATLKLDPNFDVDYSNLSVNCEYFALENTAFDAETNELVLSLRWKDQTKAIDPDTANPIVILAGIKLTPKDDAAWDAKDRLTVVNSGNISYDIYLRANALYSFAMKPEHQEAYSLYPFVNNDVIINGAPESGGHFSDVYKEFNDEYTLNKGLKNGWVYEDGGYAYYEDGVKYTGVRKVGQFYYDFGSDGINVGQIKYTGMFQIDGINHYAKDGLLTGGWFIDGDDKYYFDQNGKAVDGEIVLDEVQMVFENGLHVGGYSGFLEKADGKTYYYQNGSIVYGWVEVDSELYHFNTDTGVMTTGTHVIPDDEARAKGAYYDFADDGRTLRGYFNGYGYYYWAGLPKRNSWVKEGSDPDPDAWYHTNDTGHFVTSSGKESYKLELDGVTYDAVKIAIDGVVYIFNDKTGKLLLGSMVLEDGFWYYYWAGEPVNDGWFEFEGDTYYAFENGKLASGAQTIDGESYMFTERGILIKEGTTLNVTMNDGFTQMTIKANNVKDATGVKMAIWSDANGQDDLEWFEATNNGEDIWTVVIDPMCQFKDTGRYQIHAYEYLEDGTLGGLLVGTIYDLAEIGHNTGDPVKQNVVAPNCTNDGGYDLVTICEDCNKTIKTEHVTEPAVSTAHVYDDNVDGTCNICGIIRKDVEKRQLKNMLRMYNPYTGEHFYTGSEEEKDNLVAAGWKYEGVAFTFPANTGAPVYRLYDPATGEHLYTMDEEEKERLMEEGWNYENIAFNSAYDTEAVQHRLHNPYASVGAYHFTYSEEEKQNLINAGWEYEGIGWYSCY